MAGDRANATAAHNFAADLKRHGIDVMFGQSIPFQLHLAAPEFGIRQVGYRTENAGAAINAKRKRDAGAPGAL